MDKLSLEYMSPVRSGHGETGVKGLATRSKSVSFALWIAMAKTANLPAVVFMLLEPEDGKGSHRRTG